MNNIKERVSTLNTTINTVLQDINVALEGKSDTCTKLSDVPDRISSIEGSTSIPKTCKGSALVQNIEVKNIVVTATCATTTQASATVELSEETVTG